MARPAITRDNKSIASILRTFAAGGEVTYAHKRILVDGGFLTDVKKEKTEAVASAGRGRHKVVYELSGKGRNLVNLSKNWNSAN